MPQFPFFGIYHNPIYDKKLRKATKGSNFSLDGKKFTAKVVDVYDGDTLTVVFRYRGNLQQHSIRMNGYDSPEMRPPKSQPNRQQEIKAAKEAKLALEKLVKPKLVKIHCHKFDKYGRLLATVYTKPNPLKHYLLRHKPLNINQWMIDHKHGYPYTGGTKQKFSN